MYNSIYPININYRKHNPYRQNGDSSDATQRQGVDNQNNQQANTFPNGTKVSIDYTKGQINISQVLADFKNTIIAINAPSEVRDEVGLYLSLVEKESLKENPSRDIILSNLKNASRVSDVIPQNIGRCIDSKCIFKIHLKDILVFVIKDIQR